MWDPMLNRRKSAGAKVQALIAVCWSFRVIVQAAADEPSTNQPAVQPPPGFLENKTPLPDLLLKEKRPNNYFTGFPAIGWNPETGLTYGAAVQWFQNGD